MNKQELRRLIKARKKEFSEGGNRMLAPGVFSDIEKLDSFIQARTVLAFWSLPDEIETFDFIAKWGAAKRIALPVIRGDELELRKFEGTTMLQSDGRFGVLEPVSGELIHPSEIDFALIPGVAFDISGNRLGRGKGFYDRLLPQLVNALKVGIAMPFQLVDHVPVEAHDFSMDLVICK